MGKQKFDRAEARQLMEAGWNNVMIAEKLGVNPKSICEYRHKLGLPASTTKRERKDAKPKAEKPPVIPVERISTARTAIYPTSDGNKKCLTGVYRMYAPPYTVCGFILATGHSRSQKGVPFGNQCTEYKYGNPEDIVWKTM